MVRRLLRFGVVVTASAALVLGLGPPATAAPVLQVSVNSARLVPDGAEVVLTGQYVCGPFSPDSDGVVDLTAVQGGTTGYGYLYLTVCDGSTQAWSAPVVAVNGQFAVGRVRVVGGGYACDRGPGGECAFGSFGPVWLRVRPAS